MRRIAGVLALVVAAGWWVRGGVGAEAPKPFGELPTAAQLAWQQDELTMFVHFNMDTFTGKMLGEGDEDPNLFNPTELDCRQWVKAAKEAGFKGMILTAKHHDGFCIWPTATTEHSVKSSKWREGKGDVVREFTDACHAFGMKAGIYCSPWDRNHQKMYDEEPEEYSKLYRQQLTELLSNYGPVYEMWFDGNKAKVATWPAVIETVRKLQPEAIIKQGPRVMPVLEDVRWVGNESACDPLTNWSVDPAPGTPAGAEGAGHWFPRESDTMMIGHWFWDGTPPRDLDTLLNYYYWSVGRNSILMLNVAPDKRGLFSEESVARLKEFHEALGKIFGTDFAAGKSATASNVRGGDETFGAEKAVDGDAGTYWATDDGVTTGTLEVDLGGVQTFNVVRSEEMISLGQRVAGYHVEVLGEDGEWKRVASGTTIGYRKLDRFPAVKGTKVRLVIEKSLACPTIRGFGVHMDSVSEAGEFEPAVALKEYKPKAKGAAGAATAPKG
ncbi:MAG: alpha-L-fucosidase [Phycisphaerae bacterium]